MHLVQLLLPLYDNDGVSLGRGPFARTREELTGRFGGITAYTRAPAEGEWREPGEPPTRDEVVVYEVMVDELDVDWWSAYRRELESRFRQQQLVVRALAMRML